MQLIKAQYDVSQDIHFVECEDHEKQVYRDCMVCNCFINAFKHNNSMYLVCGKHKREVRIKNEKIKSLIKKLEKELDD